MAEKQSIEQIGFFRLFNGEVGHVVYGKADGDSEVFVFEKTGDKLQWLESGWKINDQKVLVAEFLGDYDDRVDPEDDDSAAKFTFDVDNFVLCIEFGYRGEGCYWALYYDEENKRWLAIDIVSDGTISTLE